MRTFRNLLTFVRPGDEETPHTTLVHLNGLCSGGRIGVRDRRAPAVYDHDGEVV